MEVSPNSLVMLGNHNSSETAVQVAISRKHIFGLNVFGQNVFGLNDLGQSPGGVSAYEE
jgi:hypothetical protein